MVAGSIQLPSGDQGRWTGSGKWKSEVNATGEMYLRRGPNRPLWGWLESQTNIFCFQARVHCNTGWLKKEKICFSHSSAAWKTTIKVLSVSGETSLLGLQTANFSCPRIVFPLCTCGESDLWSVCLLAGHQS